MLPEDWRETLVEMIRGAAPLDGAWFRGGPALRPDDQIHIYREQFWMRLGEAAAEDVPGLAALLGEALEPLLRTYLLDCPPQTWTLTHVTAGLAEWLERRGAPPEQVDMARLDRAVSEGFLAADPRPLVLAGADARLRLAPPVTLLRPRTPVHRLRSAAMLGEATPELVAGDHPLVIYRVDREMRHWEAPPHAWSLLAAFGAGASIAGAVAAAGEAGVPEEALATHIGAWFQAFGARGLLEPCTDI